MSKGRVSIDTSDAEMAQMTMAAILAAMKNDDELAGNILRQMGDKMMGKYGPRSIKVRESE